MDYPWQIANIFTLSRLAGCERQAPRAPFLALHSVRSQGAFPPLVRLAILPMCWCAADVLLCCHCCFMVLLRREAARSHSFKRPMFARRSCSLARYTRRRSNSEVHPPRATKMCVPIACCNALSIAFLRRFASRAHACICACILACTRASSQLRLRYVKSVELVGRALT